MSSTRAVPTIALALTCTVGLAACSGESGNPAPTSAVPPKQTTTPTVMTPPPTTISYKGPASVPVAARAHTDAGRIAFAKHYIDQINETGKNPKVGVLEPLALPSCKTCANFAESVKQMKNTGQRLNGNTFEKIRVRASGELIAHAIEIICSQRKVSRVSQSGAIIDSAKPIDDVRISTSMRWETSRWMVESIRISIPGDSR